MTNLKEQAVQMVQKLPDDTMSYVINILKSLDGILNGKKNINKITPMSVKVDKSEALEAWEGIKQFKGIIPYDIDAKAELAEARNEKYKERSNYTEEREELLKDVTIDDIVSSIKKRKAKKL
jgi:hypothetical protein